MTKGLFALVAIVAVAAITAAAQTLTFRTGIDLATFGVTVVDKKGEFLTDLTAEDFEIIEDGQKQAVKYFARGTDLENGPEMHVGLLFDTSGSMTEDIKLSRSAAVKFLNTLSEAKDMTLVDFATEVRVAKYGQKDFARMVERIRGRTPDGDTALYDAMGVYLDGASEDDGRKILVLYTDGGDTRSTISFGDLMTLIRASDATVEATGGQAFFPTSMKDIEAAYEKVVSQIRAQYSLAYSSTNTKQDGAWRKVEIRVTRPDLKGMKVLSRRGYFAPYQEPPSKSK